MKGYAYGVYVSGSICIKVELKCNNYTRAYIVQVRQTITVKSIITRLWNWATYRC